ncbi:uncharacterized protein LOC124125941 [Haliotis rufescens]|uniref:uncharacterized protein LOC124125941 n=1 Tax=Haliotis rufescens TaxID=6454 RepID=UPI001EAFBF93|nr:uncharacterized protein LOC124125941 [Haliotis rufescens]XP_046345317.1 uncharacterized protein LOC124125941 [Haliotis rufescens]XP_046345326.1 uncharacterized protein LOC124125941 [Haliotis rufescens]XP_046345334.1 uncharacterized protein LOC124125941 [Haliotis rufescens]
MPARENPSYSSSRVQRAYRINGIEQSRLHGTLHLLEKQKVHQTRLTNQDIRMVSVSLDYIQSSSGKSPEGMSPEKEKLKSESEDESDEEDNEPCFMYGERIVSRRARRFKRPQSAMDRSSNRRESVSSVVSDSMTSLPPRPQSTPSRRRPTMTFQLSSGDESDRHSDSGSERTEISSCGRATPKYEWERDTSDITKKILRAQAAKRRDPRRALPQAIRRHSAFNDMPSSTVSLSPAPSRSPSPNLYPPRRSSASPSPGRNARLSEILNQRRPTMSAVDWRNHLTRNQTSPMSITAARQLARDDKMRDNENARSRVQVRVASFMQDYPLRKPNGAT